MLFTWKTENLCIVFESWRITSTFSLILSLLAIVALGVGYELVRNITCKYEERAAIRLENLPRKSSPGIQALKGGMGMCF
jgi:copper transporter 1